MAVRVQARSLATHMSACLAGALLAGCTLPPAERKLGDSDPTASIPAIKSTAEDKNLDAVAQLIEELDSDDPAVRFYAIRALRDLTGQTFDYHYYDDEIERQPALVAWRDWLQQRQAATTRPTDATSN